MKIYIIGYMGVGKTTIGKRVAGALNLPFIDLDAALEDAHQKSIASIFDAIGELGFRQKETEALRKIQKKEFVMSTGGGTPCQYENMQYMLDHGLVIWLKMSPEMLVSRLKPQKKKRPLIANIADDDLLSFINENLKLRYPYYHRAQIHFDAADFDAGRLDELVEKIRSYSR